MPMKSLPAVGSFVLVPFGGGKHQVAHVVAHTRSGRAKVRAFNRTKGTWMPNTRTLDAEDMEVASHAWTSGLPFPPDA